MCRRESGGPEGPMTDLWQLPKSATFGGETYEIRSDFRDILKILTALEDPELPELLRWQVALQLFYPKPIPDSYCRQAMEFLCDFIAAGESAAPGPRLLDWKQDAPVIVAEVNKVAGREIREAPFIHWWTFLGWFHAIGSGQLATLVSIRQKLRTGKRLEDWEQEFYRQNRKKVDLPKRRTAEEQAQIHRLNQLLAGTAPASQKGGIQ